MRLFSADEEISVDVGTWSIWNSIYSTAIIALSDEQKKKIPQAIIFLKNCRCSIEEVKSTKQQMIMLKDAFSELDPNQVVYDFQKPDVPPPWGNNIAPTVTSCANLFTTADGEDLFTKIIELLNYAQENNTSVLAE